jgi:glycerophosphoryl diester phosphodiesterase
VTLRIAPHDTRVIAHRGAWGELPENTLEAFDEAVRVGVDMIELDVRRTADGHLIAYHDADADGVPIDGLRRDEFRAKGAGSPPPLLLDVLRQLTGRIAINLELKERGCEAEVVALLTRFGMEDRLLTSFLDDVVCELKALAPQVSAGLVIGGASAEDALLRARRCNADCLAFEVGLADAATIARAAVAAIPCLVWTVNDLEAIDRCLREPAVVGLITDRPAVALARRALLSDQTAPATRS